MYATHFPKQTQPIDKTQTPSNDPIKLLSQPTWY